MSGKPRLTQHPVTEPVPLAIHDWLKEEYPAYTHDLARVLFVPNINIRFGTRTSLYALNFDTDHLRIYGTKAEEAWTLNYEHPDLIEQIQCILKAKLVPHARFTLPWRRPK